MNQSTAFEQAERVRAGTATEIQDSGDHWCWAPCWESADPAEAAGDVVRRLSPGLRRVRITRPFGRDFAGMDPAAIRAALEARWPGLAFEVEGEADAHA